MDRPSWAPPGVDIDRPASSRIYDYMIGGSHNFGPDREVAKRAIAAMPQLPMVLRENRRLLQRMVRYLVTEAGIDQFLDLGSGIPAAGSVHSVAQHVNPRARVLYVDIDPVALAHAEAILADNPHAAVLRADLRHPLAILESQELLDRSRPIAALLIATLHFVPDAQDPSHILAQLRQHLAPGSYVALSHASDDGTPPTGIHDAQEIYARSDNPVIMRSHDEIATLLSGWHIIEPGIVPCPLWPIPEPPTTGLDPNHFPGYAAMARNA